MQVEEVRRAFDDADKYLKDNTSVWVRTHLIGKMVREIRFDTYLELGSGDGSISLSLLSDNRRLVLVDISEVMIARAREKIPQELFSNVECVVADIYSFVTEEKFDLVICVGVLAHVPSIERLIEKIASLLKDDGYLIVQFTESHSLFGWFIYRFSRHARGGYEVSKTSQAALMPLLFSQGLGLVCKRAYCDSNMKLGKISIRLACYFKLFTSMLNLPWLFSEVIMLLERNKKLGPEG